MFDVGDRVELISDSYKDGGHFKEDIGTVVDQVMTNHGKWSEQDIRVEWDSGAEECWISSDDFSIL
ncbi:hypothetical protein J2TS6_43800 [Paenibacillus albilobatus]|uniref:DUF4314 domain-containing protein n=1 Tax=Paenibacillus albilobatus TaxID=2716884 RepID=A0A919XK44_9BACL|nr:hypothetical protein J2TS6_43800 [Paenibacillus albilobatus]